jgi:hypothetical protein
MLGGEASSDSNIISIADRETSMAKSAINQSFYFGGQEAV